MPRYELHPDLTLWSDGVKIGDGVRSFHTDGPGTLFVLNRANEVARYDGTPGGWTAVSGHDVQKMGVAGGRLYALNDNYQLARFDGSPGAWSVVSGRRPVTPQGEVCPPMFGLKVDGWHKFADPVLPTRPGRWDGVATRDICLITSDVGGSVVKEADGSIRAFYGGHGVDDVDHVVRWNVGSARSYDDGFTWVERSEPLIPRAARRRWCHGGLHQPSVIRLSRTGELMMMAQGWKVADNGPHNGSLGVLVSSPDSDNWTDMGPRLTTAQFSYEQGARGQDGRPLGPISEIGVPAVIARRRYENDEAVNDFLVLFEAQEYGSHAWRIFGATSRHFAGTWTPFNGGKPILSVDGKHPWENHGVANPKLLLIQGPTPSEPSLV